MLQFGMLNTRGRCNSLATQTMLAKPKVKALQRWTWLSIPFPLALQNPEDDVLIFCKSVIKKAEFISSKQIDSFFIDKYCNNV